MDDPDLKISINQYHCYWAERTKSDINVPMQSGKTNNIMGQRIIIHNHKDNPSLIIYPALKDGRELYLAAAK